MNVGAVRVHDVQHERGLVVVLVLGGELRLVLVQQDGAGLPLTRRGEHDAAVGEVVRHDVMAFLLGRVGADDATERPAGGVVLPDVPGRLIFLVRVLDDEREEAEHARAATRPPPLRLQSTCEITPRSDSLSMVRICSCRSAGNWIDDPVDGRGRGRGVQRAEDQVTGLRRLDRDGDGLRDRASRRPESLLAPVLTQREERWKNSACRNEARAGVSSSSCACAETRSDLRWLRCGNSASH